MDGRDYILLLFFSVSEFTIMRYLHGDRCASFVPTTFPFSTFFLSTEKHAKTLLLWQITAIDSFKASDSFHSPEKKIKRIYKMKF